MLDGAGVVAGVEQAEVELARRPRPPEAQEVNRRRAIAGHEDVVRFAHDVLARPPLDVQPPLVVLVLHGVAAEADGDHVVGLGELPREVEQQPLVGLLHLRPVVELLAEDAIFVADAVADGGNVERGQRVEEASRQPSQTAVAQPRLRVNLQQALQREVAAFHRRGGQVVRVAVEQVLLQLPAQQILGRQVVDHARIHGVAHVHGAAEALDQMVAHRARQGHVDVVGAGRLDVGPARVVEVVDDILPKRFGRSPGAVGGWLLDFHSTLSNQPGNAPGDDRSGYGVRSGGNALAELRARRLPPGANG